MNYSFFFMYLTDVKKSYFRYSVHACMLSCLSRVQHCATLWKEPTRLLCPQDSLGKNTGVGCHFLLQEIFLIQGLNQETALQADSFTIGDSLRSLPDLEAIILPTVILKLDLEYVLIYSSFN